MKRIILLAAVAVLAAALVWQEAVYAEPLRLHVMANSDSAADQSVKLEVRDAVLEAADDVFAGTLTLAQAQEAARENAALFERTADAVLRQRGMDYTSRVEIGEFDFPERDYAGIVYPAGKYHALRVVLGEGEGKNWWCVMYPALCVTGRKNTQERVVVKSAILEWIRSIT